MAELHLIHDGSLDLDRLAEKCPDARLSASVWREAEPPPPGSRVGAYLPVDQLRELLLEACEQNWQVALLPHPEALMAARSAGVDRNLAKAVTACLEAEAVDTDLLTCNGQIVFSSVVAGEVLSLRPYEASLKPSRWRLFLNALRGLGSMRLKPLTITTGKDQRLETAALGMMAVQSSRSSLVGRRFTDAVAVNDGRFGFLLVAPRSILAFLGLLLRLVLRRRVSMTPVPPHLGLIRSKRILVESDSGIDYFIDGVSLGARRLEFQVLEKPLQLLPGPGYVLAGERSADGGKDTVRTAALPAAETAKQMAGRSLPLFQHASEADYRDLFILLRTDATLSSQFLVLLILSVLLALLGLYANSAPVIIGAMILAPLMAPIISLAMGLARTEFKLIRTAARTLAIGVSSALACAMLVAWMMPFENLTPEMRARLVPNLLDLGVAVISGIAGAYASSKEEIAKSLAGVAIAVALVPPLSVAGIGLGWGEWAMAQGSLLLFATNLVGIVLAAVLTFLVLGFAPFKLVRRGLAPTLAVLAAILSPLYFSFMDLVSQGRIVDAIPRQLDMDGRPLQLRVSRVRMGAPVQIEMVVTAPQFMEVSDFDRLKTLIEQFTGRHVELEAEFHLKR